MEIRASVQFCSTYSEVFKIVSYDKPYTQYAGHCTIQPSETGRVLKVFKHELCQYEPADITTDFHEDSQSDISVRPIN